jgi:hypothetical protein
VSYVVCHIAAQPAQHIVLAAQRLHLTSTSVQAANTVATSNTQFSAVIMLRGSLTKQEETNCTVFLDKMMAPPFVLLRGPLLVLVVFFPLIARYLLSLQTLLSVGLLVLGLSLTCHDVTLLLERKARIFLRGSLDSVILDNSLKCIFDPQVGILSCVLSTVMGNTAMYALPLSRSQRLRLVQSCLSISDEELAKDIMLAPGGVRQLLPTSIQRWLDQEPSCEEATFMPTTTSRRSVDVEVDMDDDEDESQGSLIRECHDTDMESDSDAEGHVSNRTSSNKQDQHQHKKKRTTRQAPPSTATTANTHQSSSPSRPPDLWVVVRTIVKELSQETILHTVQGIPDSLLQGATVAGALALCIQLRCSPRARRILLDVVEGSTAMGLGSLMISALAAMIMKQRVSRTEPMSGSRPPGTVTAAGFSRTVLSRLTSLLSGHVNSKKIQAAIAFLLLYSFQRIRGNRGIPRRV